MNALRWIAYCLVGLLLCCGLGALAFDALVVRPDRLDVAQAAKLVAIAYAPSAYLDSPERLARRTRYLLSLSSQ
ncbi:hypothetical protein [Pseudoduganella sp. RAF53_2]|uniref:hypothetical protein n=1 Tax=Pseudoduganella sp. RAF53_2 TaxID=3233060 RepID=UPI003F94F306